MSANEISPACIGLNELLVSARLEPLSPETVARFDSYLNLILRWNTRMNLTAIRDRQDILTRHFVESIACAQSLPQGIGTLLDFGSGAGFPGVPIALCRPEIAVTLAESQNKKASFLREVVRSVGLQTVVLAQRAEAVGAQFDCVTLRAVDEMARAVRSATALVRESGWLALMTTAADLPEMQQVAGANFDFSQAIPLPGSEERILALGLKRPPGRNS
ncbi:16S rRNA (guanine(527)-N(7))-methyltransferase RsmG [Telmatobacter sp. DSM 110680]|uniref:Ribosomal RNA small subunit methyltransferase G n=1 Tax=Telmatobacter sp. DSM 110680 TaxID=3036704 RepID=A0AAU7DL26_9BACT